LEGIAGNPYNVGNDNCITSISNLANILIQLYPEKNLKIFKANQNNTNYINSLVSKNIPNIEKLNKLNWSPNILIEEGFKRTIEYYNLNKN
jgi:nucleoside-diphosphate-sugar epimerase